MVSVDVRIILKWILKHLLQEILMVAEFLTYTLLHNKWENKTLFKRRIVITYMYQHKHINCIQFKLQIIHTHEPSYMFQGINRHPQGDTNTKPYILLKHQMYIHNVEMYSSSYKYNNVPNMDSMMLTCFWLKFISMPLFTVCAVIHTQTFSIAVFDPEESRSCACIDVSCVGVLYEQY
jgi:hypothetical protein